MMDPVPPRLPEADLGSPAARTVRLGAIANYLGLLSVLALEVALFSSLSDNFFSRPVLATIANQIPGLTVIAVGMTFVLIIGGIDLSVGSVMAFAAAMMGVAMVDWGWPLWAAACLCLTTGVLCGLGNGCTTVAFGIPSFIVTLGMLEIARGAAYHVTDQQTKHIGLAIEGIAAPIEGLGVSAAFLIALVVVVAGQLLLSWTVFGRHATAIGYNEQVVRYSGIKPWPTKIAVFAIAGLLSGLAGIFQSSRLGSVDSNAGVGIELAAIAAVVIGGTSLMGGRGSVLSTFLGVLIIKILQSGLSQWGASDPVKRIITGGVIIVAVVVDVGRRWLAARRR